MSILGLGFKRSSDAPRVVDDTVEVQQPDVTTEALQALEDHVEQIPAPELAAARLEVFQMSRVAKTLLDRAMDNLSSNDGKGLEAIDPVAAKRVAERAELASLCGGDIPTIIGFICDAIPVLRAENAIYTFLFSVQKAVNFVGSSWYRRALDPKADFDLEAFVDYREEERTAPMGLEPDGEFEQNDRAYPTQEDHEVIFAALEEVHLYLQLLSESFGHDPEQPMPYMMVMEKDEKFTSIYDLQQALDALEIKRKANAAKREVQRAEDMAAVMARARKVLLTAAARK